MLRFVTMQLRRLIGAVPLRLSGRTAGSRVLLLGACLLGLGCQGPMGTVCGDTKSGPDERILEIGRIFEAATNTAVGSAILSDFIVNGGERYSDGALRVGGGPGAEVISPSAIRCTTPCKFGFEPHVYSFLVTAPGYQAKRVEYSPTWKNVSDDCIKILSGATVVEISLDREN